MIRIFLFAALFFLAEIYITESILKNLYKYDLWKINFRADSQRRVFQIMQTIYNSNTPSIFVFGGSASREFFAPDDNLSQILHRPFHNCAVSSESPYDSLKLQTLVKPGNIIIYGIHPKSLYDHSFDQKQILQGHYFGGAYYKYPLVANDLNLPVLHQNETISALNKISPILNTYVYLLKEYIKNHSLKGIFNLKNTKTPQQYRYLSKPMEITKLNQKLDKYFKLSKKNMTDNLMLNFSLLEKMIVQSKKNQNQFILFELPFSPLVQERFKLYLPLYYQKLHRLLKKYPEVIYIDNTHLPEPKQNLFYDTIHLLPKGRKYFYDNTISTLKEVLKHD